MLLLGELERVLQQVAHRREQQLPVALDRKPRIDRGHGKSAAAGLRLQRRGDLDVGDEAGKRDQLALRRHSRRHPHVGERAIDEVAQPDQAAVEHRARGPRQPDIAGLDGGHGERGILDQVAQLVREEAQAFVQRMDPGFLEQQIALVGEFRHRIGDRVVQAAVEGSKLIDCEGLLPLECQIGDRLAKVAVVVNHLVHGEARASTALVRAALPRRRSRTGPSPRRPTRRKPYGFAGAWAVCSTRNVLMSCSRKCGMPCSSSASVGFGARRWATFNRQRSIRSARLVARNSCSIRATYAHLAVGYVRCGT